MIGCGVSAWGLAKVAAWTVSPLEVVTTRSVEGIRISSASASPLEVSLVCKEKMMSRSKHQSTMPSAEMVPCVDGSWGTAGSGVDLFWEADGGTYGCFYVVVPPQVPQLELCRLDCVSLLTLSSAGVYKSKVNEPMA